MHHAPRSLPFYALHRAPCTMHHAPRTTHHAPCTLTLNLQLRVAQSSFATQEGRQDPPRTPRRRNLRDKDQLPGRGARGSGRHHNASRSRSPARRPSYTPSHLRSSPPPYHQQPSPSKNPVFPASTAPQGLAVCALCLATDPHSTRKCRSESLWDGSKARCRKTEEGRLLTPAGTILCSDWNNRRGCTANSHEQRHECSGCGGKDHGAQKCPRAQKRPSAHAI